MTHTKGPWRVSHEASGTVIRGAHGGLVVSLESGSQAMRDADAPLIAEAGTVATETGLTPRQLADQRADLLAALTALVSWLQKSGLDKTAAGGVGPFAYEGTEYSVITDARAAIERSKP